MSSSGPKHSDIEDYLLILQLTEFVVCQYCGNIEYDPSGTGDGYDCVSCRKHTQTPLMYFPNHIHGMIDLMQQTYKMRTPRQTAAGTNALDLMKGSQLAVVVFFCTIGEILLANFLREIAKAHNIPDSVRDRLLDDHLSANQRMEKLFPAFLNVAWKQALANVNQENGMDYQATVKFYLKAVGVRNRLVHEGNQWAMPREMPRECVAYIWPLVNLFVSFHNKYVSALYRKQNRRYE